ncbi:hypothetical protein NicSoilC12_33270 [Arthrobacter sp. NicSoilC12]|nr:hypothetical protein NicSoilC12_33270 [Arthrobacter sp. NicSoilC12]
MQLDPTELTPVVNRLKRAQGQLAAVTRMLEEGGGLQGHRHAVGGRLEGSGQGRVRDHRQRT